MKSRRRRVPATSMIPFPYRLPPVGARRSLDRPGLPAHRASLSLEGLRMTMSVEKRAAAMKRVLVRLSEMFWDKPRDTFGAADLAGTSPLLTTLAEMEDKRLIEHVMFVSNPKPYLLTMSGWYNA